MTYTFTEEGAKKFLEMLKKPNPRAVETLRRCKERCKDLDMSKFGKETVRVTLRVKKKVKRN